jgi:hypothetical protein
MLGILGKATDLEFMSVKYSIECLKLPRINSGSFMSPYSWLFRAGAEVNKIEMTEPKVII